MLAGKNPKLVYIDKRGFSLHTWKMSWVKSKAHLGPLQTFVMELF